MPDLIFPQTSAVSGHARSVSLAIFLLIIAIGVAYVAGHLVVDLELVQQSSAFPYILLGFAMLIALGFEFVNGFHDTANAVAIVIYMRISRKLDTRIAGSAAKSLSSLV